MAFDAQTVVDALIEARPRRGQTYHVKPGDVVWFEYRCWESPSSADAELWYRSHNRVTVGRMIEPGGGKDIEERGFNGHPAVFRIRFSDGREFDATEDELMHDRAEFTRPDPPKKHRWMGENVLANRDPKLGRTIYSKKCGKCKRAYGQFNSAMDAEHGGLCPRCQFKGFEKVKKEFSGPKK